jgi:hypothetical protein
MSAPTARVSVELERPMDQVVEQLLHLAAYPRWNPFVVRVEGAARAEPGQQLRFDVRWPQGGGARPSIEVARVALGPNAAEVAWRFTGPLAALNLVRAERVQRVTRLTTTRSRYESEEVFHGLFARLVPLAKVQAGVEAQVRAMGAAGLGQHRA